MLVGQVICVAQQTTQAIGVSPRRRVRGGTSLDLRGEVHLHPILHTNCSNIGGHQANVLEMSIQEHLNQHF